MRNSAPPLFFLFTIFEAGILGLILQFRLRARKFIDMVKVKLESPRDQIGHGDFDT